MNLSATASGLAALASVLLCLGCDASPTLRPRHLGPPPPTEFLQTQETMIITDKPALHAWSLAGEFQKMPNGSFFIDGLTMRGLWETRTEKFAMHKASPGGDVIHDGDRIEIGGGHGSSFLNSRLGGMSDPAPFSILKEPPPQTASSRAIRYGDTFVIKGDHGYLAAPEDIPILGGTAMKFVQERSRATPFVAFRDLRAALDAAGRIRTAIRIQENRDWLFGADLPQSHRPCSTEIVSQERPGRVRFQWLFDDTLRIAMDKEVEAATIAVYWIPRAWTAEQAAQAGCSRPSPQPERR